MTTQKGNVKPRLKRSRRCLTDLSLTSGIQDYKKKARAGTPGVSTNMRTSDYGLQLRMKQTIRYYYGVNEKQFKSYYKKGLQQKGATGNNLLLLLERRLDNVVYRVGLASTRADARQLVVHGHVLVNGKKVDRPSCLLNEMDKIELTEKAKKSKRTEFAKLVFEKREKSPWIESDIDTCSGFMKNLPDATDLPSEFKVNLVVELYSK